MNYKLIIFFLLVLPFTSCERDKDIDSAPPKTIVLTRGQKSTQRPRVIENQHIEVVVSNQCLIINIKIPEGKCLLKLQELGSEKISTFEFDSSGKPIKIDTLVENDTYIEISTESGKIYQGIYYF